MEKLQTPDAWRSIVAKLQVAKAAPEPRQPAYPPPVELLPAAPDDVPVAGTAGGESPAPRTAALDEAAAAAAAGDDDESWGSWTADAVGIAAPNVTAALVDAPAASAVGGADPALLSAALDDAAAAAAASDDDESWGNWNADAVGTAAPDVAPAQQSEAPTPAGTSGARLPFVAPTAKVAASRKPPGLRKSTSTPPRQPADPPPPALLTRAAPPVRTSGSPFGAGRLVLGRDGSWARAGRSSSTPPGPRPPAHSPPAALLTRTSTSAPSGAGRDGSSALGAVPKYGADRPLSEREVLHPADMELAQTSYMDPMDFDHDWLRMGRPAVYEELPGGWWGEIVCVHDDQDCRRCVQWWWWWADGRWHRNGDLFTTGGWVFEGGT